jgi:hypothetical protein
MGSGSEELRSFFNYRGFDDEAVVRDGALEMNRVAPPFFRPLFFGESELHAAFIADELRTLLTVPFPGFIARKTGVKI